MSVEHLSTLIPVTDEYIVDYGIGTLEDQQAAAGRIEARQEAVRVMWDALPWHVKLSRRLDWRMVEARNRLAHASRALRGIDCDWD